jgi:hypothetical protein
MALVPSRDSRRFTMLTPVQSSEVKSQSIGDR